VVEVACSTDLLEDGGVCSEVSVEVSKAGLEIESLADFAFVS